MPRPQGDVGCGVLDGKLYLFGGIRSDRVLDAVSRGFVYDPADGPLGTWTRIPDMPRSLWGQSGVATASSIYSFGGAPTDSPFETGNPPTDEIFKFVPGEGWTDLTAERGVRCPYPTWAMRGVYNPDDGLIYNACGATYTRDDGYGNESRLWAFDPESETVADPTLATLGRARRWPTVALVEVDGSRSLQVIGGLASGPVADNDRYEFTSGRVRSMANAPKNRSYGTKNDPVIDNEVYLAGGLHVTGRVSEASYRRHCHKYDPVADDWTVGGLPEPRYRRGGGSADGVIDGTLYVAGGHYKHFDEDGFHEALPYLEAFRPP